MSQDSAEAAGRIDALQEMDVGDTASASVNNDDCACTDEEKPVGREFRDQSTETQEQTFRPILLDVQLLETKRGYLIKELAFKTPPIQTPPNGVQYWPPADRSVYYTCYRHDVGDVPTHRTIDVAGRTHDRFTGLDIECGEVDYSDEHVVRELLCFNLIFLKGHNKKRILLELFRRCSHLVYEMPRIVNVDSNTMEEDDLSFCQNHQVGKADFSFKFVYRRFLKYLDLVFDHNASMTSDAPVYLNNAVVEDERYSVYARGRPLWICPQDHTCGQSWFSSQRCAALNLGMLETLWYTMRDKDYRDLVKTENRFPLTTRAGEMDSPKSRYNTVRRNNRYGRRPVSHHYVSSANDRIDPYGC